MKLSTIATAATAALALVGSAHATSFTNGNFASNTGAGQVGFNTTATGWSMVNTSSYGFLFATGTADTTGANGQYGNVSLWGSNNGGLNAIPAPPSGSGWFFGEDGDFQSSAIAQNITGLTSGATYTVTFNYGFAQQFGFSSDTQQNWTVCLGASCQTTQTLTNPSHGFTGWFSQTFNFTASSTAETLSFLAFGNLPVPPFALLDGVTFSPAGVPEPAAWTMMLLGVGALGAMARRRRAAALAA